MPAVVLNFSDNAVTIPCEDLLRGPKQREPCDTFPATVSLPSSTTVTAMPATTFLPSDLNGPHINHFYDRFPPQPYSAHVTVGIIMTIVGIVAVLGNFFIVYIFVRFRSLRTPGSVFVPNLAIADGLMALTGFPLYAASSFKGHWIFGAHVCQLYGMCGAAFGLMSINTLAAIALERYMVIVKCHPVGRNSSRRQVIVQLVVVWTNSFVWAIAPVLGWNRYVLEGFGTTCSFDYTTRTLLYRSLVMTMFFFGFIGPLLLIIYCYIYIIAFVYDSERHLTLTSAVMDAKLWKGAQEICRRTELRIARTVLLNVVLFCVSWLPYSAIALIGQFGDQRLITPATSAIPGILAKMSTMYNPIIYSFSHPRVKQKIKILLRSYFPELSILGDMELSARQHRLSLLRSASVRRQGESIKTRPLGSKELNHSKVRTLPSSESSSEDVFTGRACNERARSGIVQRGRTCSLYTFTASSDTSTNRRAYYRSQPDCSSSCGQVSILKEKRVIYRCQRLSSLNISTDSGHTQVPCVPVSLTEGLSIGDPV